MFGLEKFGLCVVCYVNLGVICRKCGWIGLREGFACLYQQKLWRLLELKIGDIGIGFLLRNLGVISDHVLHMDMI